MMKEKLIPVLLGADLNCYNVARAFHEEYGVISYAFGKCPLGATSNSRIVKFTSVPKLSDPGVMRSVLQTFAQEHSGQTLIAIGCTDEYAEMLIEYKEELSKWYIVPYASADLVRQITQKDLFYQYCDRFSIPHPDTVVFGPDTDYGALDSLPFDYPVIIKPTSSAEYWRHPFDGMKKVYVAHNRREAERIIRDIYASGYPMNLVIQDLIPGDDSHMYVLTSYSDQNGKVRMMCLGHVLLEEHTPKGLGNHAAIITEENRPLMEQYRTFLEGIGFVGFSNFDIKYDARTGTYRAFEINTRQGRSNYYVTATGNNIARLIVEDYVTRNLRPGCVYNQKKIFWRYIPDRVVYNYVNEKLCRQVKALKESGDIASSLRYSHDLRFNLKRFAYVVVHEHHHIKKYKTYYKVEKE